MLKILYQDPAIVVCEKPFRVLSTDEPGGMPDCIRQALGRPEAEVRTVHRLDQVVGGLMVYALTPQAASDLSRQIREDRFLKEYLAVIHWRPREEEGTFLDLLGRNPKTRKTYVAKLPGKGIQQAVLHYRVVDSRQGSPWCPSGWRPGGPIRSGPSSPPGASPWRGTGSTASTPIPRSGRSPCGPTTWPLPIRRPARPWISVWIPLGRGPGRSSPTREGEEPCWTGAGPDPTTCQGQHEAADPSGGRLRRHLGAQRPVAPPALYHR